jgi:hypothetical protein
MTLSIKPLNSDDEMRIVKMCIEIQSAPEMIALPWGQSMPEMMAACPIASSDSVDPPNQAVVGPWGFRRDPRVL